METVLAKPAAERTPDEKLILAAHYLRRRAAEGLGRLPPPVSVWAAGRTATNERGVITFAEPRAIRVLKRGDLEGYVGASAING